MGYKCYGLAIGGVCITRHYDFDETIFPFQQHSSSSAVYHASDQPWLTIQSSVPSTKSSSVRYLSSAPGNFSDQHLASVMTSKVGGTQTRGSADPERPR